MKKKIKYTDESMFLGETVKDFLPPPSQLVKRKSTIKVTLELSTSSLGLFKKIAKREHVPYQRMLRELIDICAQQYARREDRAR